MSKKKKIPITWRTLKILVENSTYLPLETEKEKRKRIAELKANYELWCKHYFPKK